MEIKAKKSLGQNFLTDKDVLGKIANSLETNSNDLIMEIGPGMGALTKYLKEKGSYLIAFEIDERFKDILNTFNDKKTKIVFQDFLKVDIDKELNSYNYENIYVIANIPYYITTPIIKKVITLNKLDSMTILVQKEVAERFTAKPNTKDYGSLTVFLQYYFQVEYLFTVKRECFKPIPKVDSAVVRFKRRKESLNILNEDIFFKLVNDAFRMKRKTLKNNLTNYPWEIIEAILNKHSLPINVRAEQISIEVFKEIANSLT